MSVASSAVKVIRKIITNKPRKTILQSRSAIAHSIDNQMAKTRKIPSKEAKALAEREVGPRGSRLVSIEAKDKYGKPIKGSPPITDAKPAKKIVVKPSERLTGRPAGESVVTKPKPIGPKLDLARQTYKDLGGGKVSPERRAEIKPLIDKRVKSDTKVTRSGLNDIQPVRPPLSTDKPPNNIRVYKKVIKKVAKTKPVTTPKPRTDKPIQGPAKIKRRRPSTGVTSLGGPPKGVKLAEVKSDSKTDTSTLLETIGGLSEKQVAIYKDLAKKNQDIAREYAESIANKKPPKVNRPVKKIVEENPTSKMTKTDQIKARRIDRKIFKKRKEAQIKSIKKRIKDN